jgi:undecaprenyl-diphosphatase
VAAVDGRRDAWVCAAAAAVVCLSCAAASRHPQADRRLFAAVNHRHEPVGLVVLQQAGTPWVLPGLALAAAIAGRRRLALSAALALPAEKALEVGLKKARPVPRPLYVEPTVLRDDAPVEGESVPSGHAAIAFAAAGLAAPHAPAPARVALFAAATGEEVARVSQGAHHPVDLLGGAALGTGLAAGLRWVVGR